MPRKMKNQENTTSSKDHNNPLATKPKFMETWNLPNKEF